MLLFKAQRLDTLADPPKGHYRLAVDQNGTPVLIDDLRNIKPIGGSIVTLTRAGQVLTAKLGGSNLGDITFYRDGAAISGATATGVNSLTYTLQLADNDKDITARAENVEVVSNAISV